MTRALRLAVTLASLQILPCAAYPVVASPCQSCTVIDDDACLSDAWGDMNDYGDARSVFRRYTTPLSRR